MVWQSAFTSIIEKALPANEADAITAAVDKAAKDGSAEARSFTSALLEAQAFLAPKILPQPTQKFESGALASTTERLQAATK